MKNSAFKAILFVIAAMVLLWPALAQQSPLTVNQLQNVWGLASNGVCAGISFKPSDWLSHKDDFECSMALGNVTTNFLWAWIPPFERRYEIQLLGPDGNQVRQLKPLFWSQKILWSGLRPLSTNSTKDSLDWFFLKDTFDIKTNGQFTLIASMRVNVFTNFIVGQMQMQSKPSYFLLPPVTNTFNILPPNVQTNSLTK